MTRCCICGKEIKDEVRDGNNPDPLKDENGKFLADDPINNLCCQHCDNTYVTPYRICKHCELIQAKVLDLRKGWLKR